MVITENNVGGSQESVITVWNSQEYNLLSVSMGLTSWPKQPGMQRIQEKKMCLYWSTNAWYYLQRIT